MASAKSDQEHQAGQIADLENMLNEGIDDIDAGRTVTMEQHRCEIEALFRSRQRRKTEALRQ